MKHQSKASFLRAAQAHGLGYVGIIKGALSLVEEALSRSEIREKCAPLVLDPVTVKSGGRYERAMKDGRTSHGNLTGKDTVYFDGLFFVIHTDNTGERMEDISLVYTGKGDLLT